MKFKINDLVKVKNSYKNNIYRIDDIIKGISGRLIYICKSTHSSYSEDFKEKDLVEW